MTIGLRNVQHALQSLSTFGLFWQTCVNMYRSLWNLAKLFVPLALPSTSGLGPDMRQLRPKRSKVRVEEGAVEVEAESGWQPNGSASASNPPN